MQRVLCTILAGASPDRPEAWPYEGDWLSDIRAEGPANYYDPFSGK